MVLEYENNEHPDENTLDSHSELNHPDEGNPPPEEEDIQASESQESESGELQPEVEPTVPADDDNTPQEEGIAEEVASESPEVISEEKEELTTDTSVEETPEDSSPEVSEPTPVDVEVAETPVAETPVAETPVAETPVAETPAVETPAVETPAVETPAVETPAVETPAVETPAVETPAVETPAVETPAVETPAVETPAVETPAVETPAVETPAVETPAVETPAVETPAAETPAAETPAAETPAAETPAAETPAAETPAAETPVAETPATETPVAETPVAETPAAETPAAETPAAETPAAETPAAETPAEEEVPAPTLTEEDKVLLSNLDNILASDQSELLLEAPPEALITMMLYFASVDDSEVGDYIPRVGLLKRSFDAIKVKEPLSDEQLITFRNSLANFNKKRDAFFKAREGSKRQNAEQKRELLRSIKAIVDAGDVMKIKEIRSIQERWKEVGPVPKQEMDELYREYRSLLDKFYQQRGMHFELLDYDRKINLQEKERLIQEVRKLIPPEEERSDVELWKRKMDIFTELNQLWKSTGHVPREDVERIRDEYRTAVDEFFEIRQAFVELQDQNRQENGEKKQELLTEFEKFREFNAEKPREWNEASSQLKALQDAWKSIGPAPGQINGELWQKYREICDVFFTNKSNFFKKLDETRSENLVKKRELCERAEAINSNTEWEKTARELKQLQRDWKQIGPVPERYSNKLWNRFRAACDAFFESRRLHYQDLHKDEHANLAKKKELIEEVRKLISQEDVQIDPAIERIKELQAKWREIGKVPYKEKDRIWEEFRGEIDTFFNGLSVKREKLRDIRMRSSIDSISNPDQRGRQIKSKIMRFRKKVQQIQTKVDQYSNNMLYISKGKSGDALRKQIQDEIDREKHNIEDLKKQIRTLNDLLKNPPPPEEKKPEKVEESPAKVEEQAAETPSAEAEETAKPVVEESADKPEEKAASESPEAVETPAAVPQEEEADSSTSQPEQPEATSEETSSPAAEAEVVTETEENPPASTEEESPEETKTEEDKTSE